jgi:hypothetical protein
MAYLLRLLRLRYLIFGTAVGGGYAAHKVKFTFYIFVFQLNLIVFLYRNIMTSKMRYQIYHG